MDNLLCIMTLILLPLAIALRLPDSFVANDLLVPEKRAATVPSGDSPVTPTPSPQSSQGKVPNPDEAEWQFIPTRLDILDPPSPADEWLIHLYTVVMEEARTKYSRSDDQAVAYKYGQIELLFVNIGPKHTNLFWPVIENLCEYMRLKAGRGMPLMFEGAMVSKSRPEWMFSAKLRVV